MLHSDNIQEIQAKIQISKMQCEKFEIERKFILQEMLEIIKKYKKYQIETYAPTDNLEINLVGLPKDKNITLTNIQMLVEESQLYPTLGSSKLIDFLESKEFDIFKEKSNSFDLSTKITESEKQLTPIKIKLMPQLKKIVESIYSENEKIKQSEQAIRIIKFNNLKYTIQLNEAFIDKNFSNKKIESFGTLFLLPEISDQEITDENIESIATQCNLITTRLTDLRRLRAFEIFIAKEKKFKKDLDDCGFIISFKNQFMKKYLPGLFAEHSLREDIYEIKKLMIEYKIKILDKKIRENRFNLTVFLSKTPREDIQKNNSIVNYLNKTNSLIKNIKHIQINTSLSVQELNALDNSIDNMQIENEIITDKINAFNPFKNQYERDDIEEKDENISENMRSPIKSSAQRVKEQEEKTEKRKQALEKIKKFLEDYESENLKTTGLRYLFMSSEKTRLKQHIIGGLKKDIQNIINELEINKTDQSTKCTSAIQNLLIKLDENAEILSAHRNCLYGFFKPKSGGQKLIENILNLSEVNVIRKQYRIAKLIG